MHAAERDIWNITNNPLDLKTDFLRQQLQNEMSQPEVEAPQAKKQVDSFIIIAQRNATMIWKAALK